MASFITTKISKIIIVHFLALIPTILKKYLFIIFHSSFKERGARYALLKLPEAQKNKGVISASLGNHAQVLLQYSICFSCPGIVKLFLILGFKLSRLQIEYSSHRGYA